MAPTRHVIAEGSFGNLTAEQSAQLRYFWHTVFMLNSMFDTMGPIVSDPSKVGAQTTQSNGGGWFGRKSAPAAPTPKYSAEVQEALELITRDEREQQQLVRQWQQLLALQSPESVRALRDSLAQQSPDALEQLRQVIAMQTPESIKEFQKLLHGQSAQSIRAMVINAVKHEHPDSVALRFLRARKWDLNKSLLMMFKALIWRHQKAHVDDDIILRGEAGMAADEQNGDKAARTLGHDFLKQIRMGKSFFHGTDRQDRPICVVRARLHKASDQCVESIERYTVFLIETGRFVLNPPIETAVSLANLPPTLARRCCYYTDAHPLPSVWSLT